MQHRRVGFSGFDRIEQRLQFFVFDLDQIDRLFGREPRLCGHCRNFFADEPDHAIRNDRRVVDTAADAQTGHILTGEHRLSRPARSKPCWYRSV